MIVLSGDSAQRPMTPSARENRATTEEAKVLGFKVYYMPEDFSRCETAENALAHVPIQQPEEHGVWIGFIPDPDRYDAIYQEALRKGIRLLNSTEEHLRAQEFDRAYPHLEGLTPPSVIIEDPAQAQRAAKAVGLPAFVKGVVQSRKSRGWKACVADTVDELERLTSSLLTLEGRSRGRIVVRKLERLRHVQTSPQGFPFGREYRVFMYGERVLGWGYYWEGEDPLRATSPAEEKEVLSLAREAAKRLAVPFVALDVGQTEDGRWIVIEAGDAQFSGYSTIPVFDLWHQIKRIGEEDDTVDI